MLHFFLKKFQFISVFYFLTIFEITWQKLKQDASNFARLLWNFVNLAQTINLYFLKRYKEILNVQFSSFCKWHWEKLLNYLRNELSLLAGLCFLHSTKRSIFLDQRHLMTFSRRQCITPGSMMISLCHLREQVFSKKTFIIDESSRNWITEGNVLKSFLSVETMVHYSLQQNDTSHLVC